VDFMTGYLGIPRQRIRAVPLGINLDGHRPTPARLEPPYTIGYFGRIAPEKGLHLLAEAYHRLRQRPDAPPTRLLAGGYMLDEHRPYLAGIEQRLRDCGLAGEFRYAGAPDRAGKIALLHDMDVFSMPATYDEPKGFTLLEAMANGVPIVQPRRGAFAEIVQQTGGGVLVTPDDPDALADGLLALLTDRERAAALGRAGAENVARCYSLDRMAEAAEAAYLEFASATGSRPGAFGPGPRA
jgi:glycosyltransferase involved in cell wall biosynthesis